MVNENTSPPLKQNDPIERTVHRLWLRILADAGEAQGQLDTLRESLNQLGHDTGHGGLFPVYPPGMVVDKILEQEESIRTFLRMKAITRKRDLAALIARKHFTPQEMELLGLTDFPPQTPEAA
jgi:hypothetical protein